MDNLFKNTAIIDLEEYNDLMNCKEIVENEYNFFIEKRYDFGIERFNIHHRRTRNGVHNEDIKAIFDHYNNHENYVKNIELKRKNENLLEENEKLKEKVEKLNKKRFWFDL